jgi:hypothetical protein
MSIQVFNLATSVTMTSSNTPYPLSSTQLMVSSVTIQADFNNTGRVAFGGSNVTPSNGAEIPPGDSASVGDEYRAGHTDEIDLNKLYVTSSVAGSVVRVVYTKKLHY